MSENIMLQDTDYPFFEEWLERQAEPMPEVGIDWTQRSPLSFTCLPEKEQEVKQLFERKTK